MGWVAGAIVGQAPKDPQLLLAGVCCTAGQLVACQLQGVAWMPACSQRTHQRCQTVQCRSGLGEMLH